MYPGAITKEGERVFEKLINIKGFYLAGGTALALQIGHRVSVDFDLFSDKKIKKSLLTQIEKIFLGSKIEISVNNSDELTLFIDGVKVTFLFYPFPILKPFIKYNSFPLLSVEEIAVTKAYTIGRRDSYKDYIDLYFILNKMHTNLENIIQLASSKYGEVFNARLFLEQLVYLEDIADDGIIFLKEKPDRRVIEKFFEEMIKLIKL